jgi:tetratricopeptide (TPR) repeat protein
VGNTCFNLGRMIRREGHLEAAVEWLHRAIAKLEPVVAQEPRLVDARRTLRDSHWDRALALDALGRQGETNRDWQRALELDDGSKGDQIRRQCVQSRLGMLRKPRDAAAWLAAAAEFEALKLSDAEGLYNAARLRAVAARVILEDPEVPGADQPRLAGDQADLAMAWLHKAVTEGYKDLERMKQDKHLDALRGREDFKKLLTDLAAGKG